MQVPSQDVGRGHVLPKRVLRCLCYASQLPPSRSPDPNLSLKRESLQPCTSTYTSTCLLPWSLNIFQVVEMNRLLTQPHIFMGDRQELRNSAFETAIVGFIWGYLRRRVAWIRSGEKFAVAKNGRVLQAAVVSSNGALRAACGSLALSLLAGYRFYLRDQTLDREKGRHGTVVMSCARAALDLGAFVCLFVIFWLLLSLSSIDGSLLFVFFSLIF